jgi:hypothetical protein
MRRDWLHDAMERRLLALALGSASWLWLLALAPGLSTLAKRRCDEGLEHNGAKAIWRRPSRLLPLFPLSLALGLSTLATRRCDEGLEHNGAKAIWRRPSRLFPLFPLNLALGLSTLAKGWRLMGRSCGAKSFLALPPLPPYPNQHQSTTTSRDISRVVLKSLENVMSGVTLHGCLWCWAILYV